MFGGQIGTRRITTSSAMIGTAGQPMRLFNATVVPGSGAAVTLTLTNGSTGDAYATLQTVSGTTGTWNWEGGLLFPNGLAVDQDGMVGNAYATFGVRNEA